VTEATIRRREAFWKEMHIYSELSLFSGRLSESVPDAVPIGSVNVVVDDLASL